MNEHRRSPGTGCRRRPASMRWALAAPGRGALLAVVLGVVLCLHPGWASAANDTAVLKIGVLAIRGAEPCLAQWSPTAEYLGRRLGDRKVVIVPLTHEAVHRAVEKGAIDFVLANPAIYVALERRYGANRIATLKERRGGGIYTRYGGVVFCRKDRTDIRRPTDLVGKSFMAVSPLSLGGWLMALREFKALGIDPAKDFASLQFAGTHDAVVYAVLARQVDAGTVRTGILESLAAEGRIDLDQLFVFPQMSADTAPTPYLCSTRQYPLWPMAKVRHTPDALAERLAVALLEMAPDAPAARAAGCAGWTIPLNYQSVHECLRELKVAPYADVGKITITDVIKTYGYWIIFACAAFCIMAAFTGALLRLNRRLRSAHARLKVEMDLHRRKDRELKAAKELAESAARAKSEFLANMSHEIRTPMNGVIAAADLALGEEVPPKVGDYLQIIQRSAYSLLGIINDILDFSKIEAGKFELKERRFRLNEVFDRVMELFVGKAGEKGIELLVDIDPRTPKVLIGDPLRLQQILTNLLSNACKFTDAGGVILISAAVGPGATAEADGDAVELAFSVKDTGTGIAPEYIDRLFEPFSQADTSSTRKYEGTGLGLSICKQLVTLMAGDIGVESRLGEGSTFFFTVRMHRPASRGGARPALPPDIQGLNVLVVDDLADCRAVMRKMLSDMGFRVEAVASGAEALRRLTDNALRNTPIELIMMDWRMPEMDGIAVAREIRQTLKLAMPIIMMTAFGKEAQRAAAEKAGINGFLVKPIYPSTLFDAIMDGFGKEGAREGGRSQPFTTRASIYRKHLKGARILVAEDNPTNQQVAQAILEGAGIVPTIVANGEAAVAAVRRNAFDAVLMDIQMPRMNGYEATRQIRQLPAGKSLPIVAMTAHAMKGDEERCLEAGMDGYVSKPVNQDRLFHTLWRLLRSSRPAVEAEADADTDENAAFPDSAQPPPAAATDDAGLPLRLPGLDLQGALAALEIDGVTLARILRGFMADNRDTPARLKQALDAGDGDALGRLAHSLKGSAANIGAVDLSAAARQLEQGMRDDGAVDRDAARVAAAVDRVTDALETALASIRLLDAPTEGAAAVVDNADDNLDTLLERLAAAIRRADPALVMEIMPAVRRQVAAGIVDPSVLDTLASQVDRYDYDDALQTIEHLRRPSQGDS